MPTKSSPDARARREEVWRQLVDEAGEDEIERAASVSVAQAEKDLARAGFDVAAERAKADALIGELEAGRSSGKVAIATAAREPPMALVTRVPEPKGKERKGSMVLIAAATLVLGAAIIVILSVILPLIRGGDITADRVASTSSSKQRAAVLRRYATDACRKRRWDACRQSLDDARTLDPAGEETPEVVTLRKTIDETAPTPPLRPEKNPDIKGRGPDVK